MRRINQAIIIKPRTPMPMKCGICGAGDGRRAGGGDGGCDGGGEGGAGANERGWAGKCADDTSIRRSEGVVPWLLEPAAR